MRTERTGIITLQRLRLVIPERCGYANAPTVYRWSPLLIACLSRAPKVHFERTCTPNSSNFTRSIKGEAGLVKRGDVRASSQHGALANRAANKRSIVNLIPQFPLKITTFGFLSARA